MNKLTKSTDFPLGSIKRLLSNYFLLPTMLVVLLASLSIHRASAQGEEPHWHVVRTIDTSDFGLVNPEGVTFLPDTNMFLVVDQSGNLTGIDTREQFGGTFASPIIVSEATNLAFDQSTNSLFSLDEVNSRLDKIRVTNRRLPFQPSGVNTRIDVSSFSLKGPRGITFDPRGRLIILDAIGAQILIIVPDLQTGLDGDNAFRDGRIKRIDIKSMGGENFRGIAFNPNNSHLYSLDPGDQRMVEIDENGNVVSVYDLSLLHLVNPKTLLFAPSRNVTDDPSVMNLFILDGNEETALKTLSKTDQQMLSQSSTAGGQIIEISLNAPIEVSSASLLPTTLVRTIDTSNSSWNPSSPDPGGIAYWPSRGSLLISDSEVDEMPQYFTGVNVFESSLTGSLLDTCSTTNINRQGWSNEPTGVAINPSNNHIFFSDDSVGGRIHEVSPGTDGIYCTGDDSVTTEAAPGGGDAEGVAYGDNTLYIAGGTDNEVYKFSLGTNGVLGGGDDGAVTSFDTAKLGFQDLEGIEYNPDRNTLFIVSTYKNDTYLGEVSLSGSLLYTYDLSYLGSQRRSGLAYGPSSQNPAIKSIYLASRGVDNNEDPEENDGKIWEIDLGGDVTPPTVSSIVRTNTSPTNAASVNFTVTFSETVTGVDATDFSLTTSGVSGATISNVSGSGTTRTVTVNTGSGSGTIRLNLIDNDSIIDAAGNKLGGAGAGNGTYTSGQVYTVDRTAPVVSSITRTDTNPTSAASVDFTVTFSKLVTGVDATDFSLTTTGVSGAALSGVSGSGATRTVSVDTGSGDGTIRLDLVDNDSIIDAVGNELGGTGAGNGNFTSGEVYTVSKQAIFNDVPDTYWAVQYIERLYNAGITGGCTTTPLAYCPEATATRAEMSIFLEKGLHYPAAFTPPNVAPTFNDTVGHWAEDWIEALRSDGITGGCGPSLYCPQDPVTRAQMAVFLLKSKYGNSYLPPAVGASTGFGDVPVSYWAAAWVKQLAAEGITGGCGGGNYCPENPITRAEMAVFLVQTFNLP